jgi:hypothetical protein
LGGDYKSVRQIALKAARRNDCLIRNAVGGRKSTRRSIKEGLMAAYTDFWLLMHELAQAYRSEGPNRDDRQHAILASLEEMPEIVQHEVMQDYRLLMGELCLPEAQLLPLSLERGGRRPRPVMD